MASTLDSRNRPWPVRFHRWQDTLYGSLALEPVILRLMDTPQFQRLHGLKQLGTSDYVYRSCTHTRFEHSVGGERARAADGSSRHCAARGREREREREMRILLSGGCSTTAVQRERLCHAVGSCSASNHFYLVGW